MKVLDKFEIQSKDSNMLNTNGLSSFLSDSEKLNVKIVNKDIVLFKANDLEKKYSESAVITRKSGELLHEITRNIDTKNQEKKIFFYNCKEI